MSLARRVARVALGSFRRVPERFMALEELRFAIGSLHTVHAREARTMREAEFRCYSQFGEDGVLQWLVARVPVAHEAFVEIGVESYRESNTRFLLEHDNWRGRIISSGTDHVRFIRGNAIGWRHSIEAVSAFVTRENVNSLLERLPHDIGLLSIDIDGNDYWVFDAVSVISPRIVSVEYNSVFGASRAVAIPYDPAFKRMSAHPSGLYFGASLGAMCHVAARKGYRFVGSDRTGHNAFFVREDVAGELPALTGGDGWVESRFRESRGSRGELTYLDSHADRRGAMWEMPLIDVITGDRLTVADLDSTG